MGLMDGALLGRIRNDEVLIVGGIMDSRSPAVVEVFSRAGYDVVLIDREHTCLSDETIADHVRTARCLGLPSMVRVADDSYHELNRTLDQAPDGIFVPRVKDREQVERILDIVHYPPKGRRGLAGSSCPIGNYCGWDSVAEQIKSVNENTVVGIQIETADALENLDDILSVPGIHIAVVGNDDLSMNMGIPGQTSSIQYLQTIEKIISSCQKYNVLPGIAVGDAKTGRFWLDKGMKMIWHASEIYILYRACAGEVIEMRSGV